MCIYIIVMQVLTDHGDTRRTEEETAANIIHLLFSIKKLIGSN